MWFIESFDDSIGKMIKLLYLCNGSATSRYPKMEKKCVNMVLLNKI